MTPYGDVDQDQHWFWQWLGAWRHKAITWTNDDLSSKAFSSVHQKANCSKKCFVKERGHHRTWGAPASLILIKKLGMFSTYFGYHWFRIIVCLPICSSVTPVWLCSHPLIIMKFSGVITNDHGKVHAKGQGQRAKVKVTDVTTQLNRFRTVTPVWIHIWWWDDAYSLRLLGEVPYCFSRSSVPFQGHMAIKIVEFEPDWAFPDCNSSLNSLVATKWRIKLEVV